MKKILIACLSVIFLAGCLSSDQTVRSGPDIVNDTVRRSADEIKGTIAESEHKVAESQNAMQQNLSSLIGVGISKVADKLADVKADISASITGMSNTMNNKIDKMITEFNTNVNVQNKLIATLENQINTNIKLQAQVEATNNMNAQLQAALNATLKVNAELEAKVNALATAVAGFNNKIEQTTNDIRQDVKSGRDTIQTQLDANALKAVQSGNLVAIIMVAAIALCIIALFVCYVLVKMHDKRATTAENGQKEMFKMVAKCMPGLSPETSKEIAKDIHSMKG